MDRTSKTGRVALMVALALLAAACLAAVASALAASPAASPSSSSGKVVLKLGWTEEPDNLNVFIGYNSTDWEIWALNYDYLFSSGDYNQPTLDLASEVPHPTERRHLGRRQDMDDPHKELTPSSRTGYLSLPPTWPSPTTTCIKNNMTQYTTYIAGIESAKALNPTTVQFTCARPMALGYMETESVPILPEHIWKNVTPKAAGQAMATSRRIIGSGPFETVAFVKGSYVKMVRNPYWWGQKPTIDEIYFETYQNADTMVSDLRAGRLDGAWGIPEAQFKQLESVKGIKADRLPLLRL